eukprot:1971648-Rhodomonas_salina.1
MRLCLHPNKRAHAEALRRLLLVLQGANRKMEAEVGWGWGCRVTAGGVVQGEQRRAALSDAQAGQ